MEISAISVENYKSFSSKERIEIKPLTIFIGRNSSGKSSFARLLLLMARSLSEKAESTIELAFEDFDFGDSYLDLIHNRVPHGAFGMGMTIRNSNKSQEEFWVKLQHYDEYKTLIVSEFQYKGGKTSISFKWAGRDPIKEMKTYEISSQEGIHNVDFVGIWPIISKPGPSKKLSMLKDELLEARLRFQAATREITYLGPFRDAPERTYRFSGHSAQRNVGIGGKKAPELLGDDFLRRKGLLVSSVGDWFQRNLGGWQLGVSKQGERFSLVMRKPDDSSLEVNIVDVGTGIAQVLPIVVQRYLSSSSPQIEVVEQPELHLHPGAHGGIADLYLNAANTPGARFIVETHSENFLLRTRRRIAEQSIDNSKVQVYWFDDERDTSKIIPINIAKDGSIDKWPYKVFQEDFDEVKAIHNANKKANE